jgi:GR25 family glycosyltransferase involved in LPS biosynthesis
VSHFLLWKQVAHSNEAVTIFEDDAILYRDFFSKTEDVIRSTDADWDFIQWGWNFDACMSFMLPGTESICHGFFDQDHLRTKATVFQQQDVNPNLYRLHTSFGYMACTISPAGARRLLQGCFPLKEKLISIDAYHRSIISYGLDVAAVECHQQRDSKSYVCFPPLAISKNESETSTNINSGNFR